MRGSKEATAFIALLIMYVIQTSVVARIQFPLGGPNLIYIFFLAWVLKHNAMSGALIGFVVGLLMDFAPPAVSAAGAWTFVFVIVGYGVGAIATRSQDLRNSPLVGWLFMGAGLMAIFFGRLIIGAAIGESLPGFTEILKSLVGTLIWNLLLAPLALWLSRRLFNSLTPRTELLR